MNGAHPSLAQLDLNLFRVLDVVYRERNLRRAAVTLALTQSAISHALGRLRAQLGDPLFVRQGRSIVPTALAVQLAPAVHESLSSLERALVSRRDFDARRDLGRVTLALHGEVEATLLPALVARLGRLAPQATLRVAQLDRTRLRAELASGRFDLALDVAQLSDPDLGRETLLDDVFCVVASKRRRRLDRAAYLEADHVAVSTRLSGPTLEEVAFGAAGPQRRVVVRCQRYETACRIVADSDLLLTIPRRQAEQRSRLYELRLFEPPFRMPRVQVHLYWRRELTENPANQWLRAELRALVTPPRRPGHTRSS